MVFPYIGGGDLMSYVMDGKLKQHLDDTCNDARERQKKIIEFLLGICEGLQFLHR